MKIVSISIVTAVIVIASGLGKGDTPATQAERRLEVPKSDAMKLTMRDGKPIVVASTPDIVSVKGDHTKGVPQVSVACYKLNVDNTKLSTSVLGYFDLYAFDIWVLSNLYANNAHVIAYDVEGTNPLEPPNNPMGRLTIAVSHLSKKEPESKESTDGIARRTFRSKYAKAGQRTYIRGKGIMFESAKNIDSAMWNRNSGLCVGITNKRGLWAKAFNASALKWDKKLGFVKGEYVDVAVVATKDTIGILTADRTGRIGYRSIKSAADFADSKDEMVAKTGNWKNGEHPVRVAVSADSENIIAAVVLEKGARATQNTAGKKEAVKQLVIYRGRKGGWQHMGRYMLEPSSGRVSLLQWGNMVLCAYSYTKDGKACGIVRVLTPQYSTAAPASGEEILKTNYNPGTPY